MSILATTADEDSEVDPSATLLSLHHSQDDSSAVTSRDSLPPPCTTADPHFRRHHAVSINADILIRQLPSEGISFQLWPAATAFLSLLDNHRLHPSASPLTIPRRIRILELGSGTGLVGIAAATILGADVTVTDLAHVIPNLKFNVEANSGLIAASGGAVDAAELSWGNVEHMEAIGRDYDVIVGSDVVYHDHLFEPLMETLKYFLLGERGRERKEETVFVMAHLKRWKKEAAFFKKARKVFEVDVIHRDPPSRGKRVGVVVYRFVGKHSSQATGLGLGLGPTMAKPKAMALSIPKVEDVHL